MDFQLIENMKQLLEAFEHQTGEGIFLKFMNGSDVVCITGTQFFKLARGYASRLYQKNQIGVHVGIMGENSLEWLANLCAVFMVGNVAVLLSPDLTREELIAQAKQTNLGCILCDSSFENIAADTDIPVYRLQDDINPHYETIPCLPVTPDSLACILFTSGTTSQYKAVMFSHRGLIAGICHDIIGFPFTSQLAILPLHHLAGLITVFNTWYLGRVVCLGSKIRHLYRYLDSMNPDYIFTVPSILEVILKKHKKGRWNLQMIACGGAQFPFELVSLCLNSGIRVIQSYGSTESGGIGLQCEITEGYRGALGKRTPALDVNIVNGELYLRSESLMMGYYGDPGSTHEVLIDGWYATGDLCEMDDNGAIYLKGRKKNLIILSNGENVSPEQIEQELQSHSEIEEIMVGLKDNLITAYILPRSNVSQEEITRIIRSYNRAVPRFRQIQDICYLTTPFAKTAIGKQIRRSVTGGEPHDS